MYASFCIYIKIQNIYIYPFILGEKNSYEVRDDAGDGERSCKHEEGLFNCIRYFFIYKSLLYTIFNIKKRDSCKKASTSESTIHAAETFTSKKVVLVAFFTNVLYTTSWRELP